MATQLFFERKGGGERVTWDLCHPNALLTNTTEHCPNFRKEVAAALQRHPCSHDRPWHLIYSFDEFTPGDAFDGSNARKTMAVLFTFAELGRSNLADPRTWMIPAAVRTSVISSVLGGWSAMFAALLHLHLFGLYERCSMLLMRQNCCAFADRPEISTNTTSATSAPTVAATAAAAA